MRCALVSLMLAACSEGAEAPTSVTLSVSSSLVNTRIEGAGVLCSTNAPCESNTSCTVTLDADTPVRLMVVHPVCQPGGTYFAFGWSQPCVASMNGRICEFTITRDTTLTVTGAIAVE